MVDSSLLEVLPVGFTPRASRSNGSFFLGNTTEKFSMGITRAAEPVPGDATATLQDVTAILRMLGGSDRSEEDSL